MIQGMITRKCAELVRLEQRHHNLQVRWPIGMRIADDEADSKREQLASRIETLRSYIEKLRSYQIETYRFGHVVCMAKTGVAVSKAYATQSEAEDFILGIVGPYIA